MIGWSTRMELQFQASVHQDSKGTNLAHACFQTHSPEGCRGSAGWRLPAELRGPATGPTHHEGPAHWGKARPSSPNPLTAIPHLSWNLESKLEASQ